MLKIAVAQSIELDTADALDEVFEQNNEKLGSLKPQAGILFVGIDHDFSLIIRKINERYPGIELIGCSTDGELSSVLGYTDDSITLMLFCSDQLQFKAGVAVGISKETSNLVKHEADSAKLQLGDVPSLCITTPSSLTASNDDIIKGLRLSLGKNFPIFGGAAGDQWRFKDTYQLCNKKVYTDAAPFLLIAGPLLYSFGIETGWIPIGKKALVTKSDSNVVYTIGKDSAIEFYQHHLGESISLSEGGNFAEYPLAVFEEDNDSYYLRSPIFESGVGSLRFPADVPQGSMVQITHSNRDKIVEATKISVNSSLVDYPGTKPMAALCFSCASRKQVLGTRVEEENDAFKKKFPDIPVAGFYTYGEIGPLKKDQPTKFHNETFFSLIIGIE